MDSDNEQDLLQILNAHGKNFLSSFDSSLLNGKRKGFPELYRDNLKKRKLEQEQEQDTDEQEEWNGFSGPSEAEDDNHGSEDREQDDSDAEVDVSRNHKSRYPSVVVFADTSSATTSSASTSSKAQMKAFMSSKVEKLTKHIQDEDEGESSGNEGDDLTNLQNDALLHRLVHTQILSGSLNPDLNLTPSQRRKALAGRVMEAAGEAKLGKGESTARAAERNKAAKKVREGLVAKQKERRQNALDEAKSMGNYHPAFKRLYDADSSAKTMSKKRERGLKMGVGSFSGGMLKLRQSEIASVSGDAMRGRGSFQKRGGRRR